jgi:glucose/arabinose dehydrogenase
MLRLNVVFASGWSGREGAGVVDQTHPHAGRTFPAVLVLVALVFGVLTACTPPPGFNLEVTQSGLVQPTAFAFAPDGRLFIAEKRGVIQTYDDVHDTTPTVFADLRTSVHNNSDRGMLGLVVDTRWPARPYIYVHYVYDAPPGGTAPTYGTPDTDSDPCYYYACVGQVRVDRLTVDLASGAPLLTQDKVLLQDVCHQFAYHDGGGMRMGPEGALYVSIGEGAYPNTDYGNYGNACGDPPSPAGTDLTPPSAEGGTLRAQDRRTPGDPTAVNGSVIRIDPDTGAAWPTNPQATNPDLEARKIIAFGLRNPYRLTLLPGTNEVWVGDVGSSYVEEIDRVLPAAPVENFGWPCYEGDRAQPTYRSLDLTICEQLYTATSGRARSPYYSYCHTAPSTPGGACQFGGGAISGLEFYAGGTYPAKYRGALMYVDYTRSAAWAVLPGGDGLPDPAKVEPLITGLGGAVDLRAGPDGDLFYLNIWDGDLRRIYWGQPGVPPVDNTERPTATIDTPTVDDTWAVGDTVGFSGHAVDSDGTALPASALHWSYNLLHCPTETSCHRHPIQDYGGIASGSVVALDHEYPARIELVLTATNPAGGKDSTTVVLDPRTTELTFASNPAGFVLTAGNTTEAAPFTKRVIVGSHSLVSAPSPQRRPGDLLDWYWHAWSDGGARTHDVVAGSTPLTFTATYSQLP